MSELMDYKCPNCGGALDFDPNLETLKCPFCDSEISVAALKEMDAVLNTQKPDEFNWDNTKTEEWVQAENEGLFSFVCNSCGGEIVGDENTAATSCPYCGNPVVMSGRLSGVLKPDYVIPFKLDKKAAVSALKDYVSKKKFAPNTFKSENRLNEIKGMYVPFWLFDTDADANAFYVGTTTRTWSDSKYRYTATSYYNIHREGSMRFENIPVDGSTKMPDELMESIEPFRFDEAVDFQTAYLAGFFADKYDVSVEDSINRANERVKESCEDTLRNTVTGYTSLETKSCEVFTNNGASKYALYPVWLLHTVYKGQQLEFAVNGQTGKIVGNIPVSKAKLTGLGAGLIPLITAGVFLVGKIFGLF